MKKLTITMTALAAALVMLFPGVAAADTGRVVVVPFEFYSIGHGDTGGVCLHNPTAPVPPEGAAFQSCATAIPQAEEVWVQITVQDSEGNDVYFSAQQDGNSGFAGGCGTIQWGQVVTGHAGGFLVWAINDSGPGGSAAEPVFAFPWAGPGINNVLDPGGAICEGSLDTNIIQPGESGTATFTFHKGLL